MKNLIGNIPNESGFIAKFRQHQGWWRTFVLCEPEGRYIDANGKPATVCNRINNGEKTIKNFITPEIGEIAKQAVEKHKDKPKGIIREDRLFDNLLSSQPLAFNFFGFLKLNPTLALAFIKTMRPEITEIVDIVFEFAPDSTPDHSAFDFGFIIRTDAGRGFWGFECKYTDSFSYKRAKSKVNYGDVGDIRYKDYHPIYLNNRQRLPDDYFSYVRDKKFNQLFRNELLALQLEDFDFINTGLFCHHDDKDALAAGFEFQMKIGNGRTDFQIMTYADYFENIQKLDLNWEQRELVMMLWARYCGLNLSKNVADK
jgi:hypothetical protein